MSPYVPSNSIDIINERQISVWSSNSYMIEFVKDYLSPQQMPVNTKFMGLHTALTRFPPCQI